MDICDSLLDLVKIPQVAMLKSAELLSKQEKYVSQMKTCVVKGLYDSFTHLMGIL